jgi:diguanylate cyclase (GGDEF)-like protein
MLSNHMTEGSWDDFISSRLHSPEISHVRYELIVSRVQFLARLFGVVTLAWIGVEFLFWPWPVSGALGLERLVIACAFWAVGTRRFEATPFGAYMAMLTLLFVQAGQILGVEFVLVQSGAHLGQPIGTQAYLLSPVLLVAALSIFPLTAAESLLLAGPQLLVALLPTVMWPELFATMSPMAVVLLLILIAAISGIASLSQLNFLIGLVKRSATDGLTGAMTRMFGERMLETVFAMSVRKDCALSVLFIDLDHFKLVNDRLGHSAGDEALRNAASSIRSVARQQDVLVRWGGEEFVLIMPETKGSEIPGFIARLARTGIGRTSDAVAITASMGGAERQGDAAEDWAILIAEADRRMYAAKQAGRNGYIGPGGSSMRGVFESPESGPASPVIEIADPGAPTRERPGKAGLSPEQGGRDILASKVAGS